MTTVFIAIVCIFVSVIAAIIIVNRKWAKKNTEVKIESLHKFRNRMYEKLSKEVDGLDDFEMTIVRNNGQVKYLLIQTDDLKASVYKEDEFVEYELKDNIKFKIMEIVTVATLIAVSIGIVALIIKLIVCP